MLSRLLTNQLSITVFTRPKVLPILLNYCYTENERLVWGKKYIESRMATIRMLPTDWAKRLKKNWLSFQKAGLLHN